MSAKGIKLTKKGILIIFLVFVVLFFGVLSILFTKHKKQYLDSAAYYETMLLLFETSSESKMKDVFDFEFDKAYVADEIYGDEKYFLKKLNVDTDVDIPMLETGAHNRILFIKDNRIIYDFIYDMEKIHILEKGINVYPDTSIIFIQQDFGDKETNTIQASDKLHLII